MPAAPHLGASASAGRCGNTLTASTRPVVERMPFRTPRRLTFSMPDGASSRMCLVMSRSRSLLDGGANALIGPAAANVAVHSAVDVGVGGMRRLFQQRRGLHDLAGLTIAALRHVERAPSLLKRMISRGVEAFDGGDRLAAGVADRRDAGSPGLAVDMDRAGAACGHAATEFRSREAEFIAKIPEQRHRRIAVEALRLAIDVQSQHTFLHVAAGRIAALMCFCVVKSCARLTCEARKMSLGRNRQANNRWKPFA